MGIHGLGMPVLGGSTPGAGSVGTSALEDDAVTYAKLQNVSATDRVLGRSSGGAGNVEEIAFTSAARALCDDANAAAQRATLGATLAQLRTDGGASYDGSTSAGWTLTNGSGAAAVTGGVFRLTVPDSTAVNNDIGSAIDGPRIGRTLPVDPQAWQVTARVAACTGNGQTRAFLRVRNGTARCLCAVAWPNGKIEVLNAHNGSPAKASSSTGILPVDGTGWLRLTYRNGVLALEYGTGTSTTQPTAWTIFYCAATETGGDGLAEATTLEMALGQYDAGATGVQADFDDVTVTPL